MTLTAIHKELKTVQKELAEIKSLASEVMNAKAAAMFLGISESTLAKITRPDNMLIPVAKIGGKKKVFLKSDLLEFVERNKQEAIAQ